MILSQTFITIRILDILDILLVAFLLYQVYMLIKGTVAINIFIGIFSVYLIWLLVKALKMQLVSTILGQFMGVGVIALIIVFQQEIRRFLLLIGTRKIFKNRTLLFERLFSFNIKSTSEIDIQSIVKACENLSRTKTGALIVISKKTELRTYTQTGDIINAAISSRLLETIFFKNNPLHDGAVIIVGDKIKAARCVLPVSENINLPPQLGMRHRAALGMSQATDTLVIVVSEQTGSVSYAKSGEINTNTGFIELSQLLEKEL